MEESTLTDVSNLFVATAPTVYGIETTTVIVATNVIIPVATAPTVYGIETILDCLCRR